MRSLALIVLALAGWLAGCDQQRVAKLEPGVASEADVRREFGEPTLVVEKADGTKLLEYPRQPEGVANYLAIIGADGKLSALTQQLTPDNFAQVQPGMSQDAVRRLLGKPARSQRFDLKPDEEHWEWRFEAAGGKRQVFTATFGRDAKVTSTSTGDDSRDTQPGGR